MGYSPPSSPLPVLRHGYAQCRPREHLALDAIVVGRRRPPTNDWPSGGSASSRTTGPVPPHVGTAGMEFSFSYTHPFGWSIDVARCTTTSHRPRWSPARYLERPARTGRFWSVPHGPRERAATRVLEAFGKWVPPCDGEGLSASRARNPLKGVGWIWVGSVAATGESTSSCSELRFRRSVAGIRVEGSPCGSRAARPNSPGQRA